MKKIFKYIGVTFITALTLSACSPESYTGLDEAGLPIADDANVNVTVDQNTNQVTFYMDCDQTYPLWILPSDKSIVYSTQDSLQKIFVKSGDYKVNYRVGNRNGLSQGMGEKTFKINNTIFDFSKYYTMMVGKDWKIARKEKAHLGCGPSGSDGTSWWSAQADEKAAMGVYDDVITFTADTFYTYNPGAGGTVYVNKTCTVLGGPKSDDFMASATSQKVRYGLDVEGDNLYLKFPAQTLFPYICNDNAYNSPKYRIESLTPTKMVLVNDNGAIAWHYILTCASDGFTGFNAGSDCNMWKNAKITNRFKYLPNWQQIEDPGFKANGNSYTISLPVATSEQWQAQCFFETDMSTNASNTYDFSAVFNSNKDHNNVTVKLFKTGADATLYFADVIKLKANEDYVFYKSAMPGIDMDKVSLVLDFGKNEAGTEVNVTNVDLQEHKCDGIEAPAENTDKTVYTYDAATNLWKTNVDDKGTAGFTPWFYYAPDWHQIADPNLTAANGKYTVTLPTATAAQWQAQVFLKTAIPGEANTKYDFSCTLLPTKDIKGATIKLTDVASKSDGSYDNSMFAERVDLKADNETVFKIPAKVLSQGAAQSLNLVLDFGGNLADTEVSVYNIILQKTAQ